MLSIKISYHSYPIFQEGEIRPESLPSTLTLSELKSWKSKGHGFAVTLWEASQSFSCQPRTKGGVAQWGDGSNGSWSFGISDLCSSV